MKLILGVVIIFTQIIFYANAQRVCGTDSYFKTLIAQKTNLLNGYTIAANQIAEDKRFNNTATLRDTSGDETINIPIVVHVIYSALNQNISEEQIKSQIKVLNEDYGHTNADKINIPSEFSNLAADTKIKFCLAQVDPQGRRTNGILRKLTKVTNFDFTDGVKNADRGGDNPWDCARYLNIWVCNLNGRTLGYSSLPGGPANLDGVVIAFSVFGTIGNLSVPFNKGRTATHEIGHWLGLKHIWGDAVCGSDEVDDTPTQQYFNYGCPGFPHISNCSPNAKGDLFMNFMDLTDDGCMNLFTHGQKQRMRALFAKNNLRNSFLLSFACDSTLAQSAPLPDVIQDTNTTNLNPAISNYPKKFAVSFYPSPARSSLFIAYKNGTLSYKKILRIYSIQGREIIKQTLNSEKTTINIASLAAGIYIVSISEGSNIITSKIIKQ